MRDDIHNRVPLSPAFRSLLSRCTNTAYQQKPEGLQRYAAKAVESIITSGCSRELLRRLDAEANMPNLFGSALISLPPTSALQSDLVDALRVGGSNSQQALAKATRGQVEGMCLEVEASLRAAGANRAEAASTTRTMRNALHASIDTVTARVIGGDRSQITRPVLAASTILPLGQAARGSK